MRRLGHLSRTLPPAAAHFRAYVRLRSIDPARNRDRSYALTWTPALFDVIDVIDRFIWVSGTSGES